MVGKPNANQVGSSQGVDIIEVDTNTAKLFQAWIQKQFMDERMSVLLGLYDLNSEFYVSHSTGIFLHPSPGIGSELAQTGLNGPSVFPTSSVGLRVSFLPTPETYVQAAVLDGVPGDPDNSRGTHIQFNDGDGTLRVFEVGYIPGKSKDGEQALTDKYAVGIWSYTPRGGGGFGGPRAVIVAARAAAAAAATAADAAAADAPGKRLPRLRRGLQNT